MKSAATIPVTIDPEAQALAAQLGLQAELQQMLEHARRTIAGLHALRVKFAPAYDTGEDGIVIEAVRDPASRETSAWTWDEYSRWKTSTFPPDVCRYFTLLDEYEPSHAG
jgi:hypothetical protein